MKKKTTKNHKQTSAEESANKKRLTEIRERFTNDDQKVVFDATVKNEISARLANAHKLIRCHAGNSGYSFGFVQIDIPNNNNADANEIVTAAVNNIDDKVFDAKVKDKKLTYTDDDEEKVPLTKTELINQILTVKGKDLAGVNAFHEQIDEQLKSGTMTFQGKQQKIVDVLDEISVNHVVDIAAYAQDLVKDYKNEKMRKFALTFIADVKNQFGTKVNNALAKFLKGNEVEMPDVDDVTLKPKSSVPDIMDLLEFHQNTKYARDGKHGDDLMRRFLNIATASMGEQEMTKKDADDFFAACFKDGAMSKEDGEFLVGPNGLCASFGDEEGKTYQDYLLNNGVFSYMITMGAKAYIDNKNITNLSKKAAAFFTLYNQEINGFKNDAEMAKYLNGLQGEVDLKKLVICSLNYAKDNKDHREQLLDALQSLGICTEDTTKIQVFFDGKEKITAEDLAEKHTSTATHCNGWNHKPTCVCGFGGPRK